MCRSMCMLQVLQRRAACRRYRCAHLLAELLEALLADLRQDAWQHLLDACALDVCALGVCDLFVGSSGRAQQSLRMFHRLDRPPQGAAGAQQFHAGDLCVCGLTHSSSVRGR